MDSAARAIAVEDDERLHAAANGTRPSAVKASSSISVSKDRWNSAHQRTTRMRGLRAGRLAGRIEWSAVTVPADGGAVVGHQVEAPKRAEERCVPEASALMATDHATCEPGPNRRESAAHRSLVQGGGQMGPERSLAPRMRAAAILLILCGGCVPAASAAVAPIVDGVPFLIRFHGTVRGLAPGAPVEVRGIRIGEVTNVGVDYAPDSNSFVAPVEIVLQPSLFPAAGPHPRTAAEVYDAADVLVQRGLRAQVSDTQLLGGDTIVLLDIRPNATPATLDRSGKVPELPAGRSQREVIAQQLQPLIDELANAPIDQVFAELQDAMAALKQLVAGPELRGASADLRNVVDRLGARSDALVANLNETVRSTNRLIDHTGQTLATIDRQIGDRSPLLADIRGLVQQIDRAARSMRLTAEYLERNPNALITGKSDDRR